MTVKYLYFKCERCGRDRLPMEMHNDTQCKDCWSEEYEKKSRERGRTKKYRKTKLLLGQN